MFFGSSELRAMTSPRETPTMAIATTIVITRHPIMYAARFASSILEASVPPDLLSCCVVLAPENPLDGVGSTAVVELVLSADELLFVVTELLFIVVVDTFSFVELRTITAFFITTFVAAGFGATFLVEGDDRAALIELAAAMTFAGALEICCLVDCFERSSRTLIEFWFALEEYCTCLLAAELEDPGTTQSPSDHLRTLFVDEEDETRAFQHFPVVFFFNWLFVRDLIVKPSDCSRKSAESLRT